MSEFSNPNCPCVILKEACSVNCSCVNSLMSGVCHLCATVGSDEQREAKARWLKTVILRALDLEEKPQHPLATIAPCPHCKRVPNLFPTGDDPWRRTGCLRSSCKGPGKAFDTMGEWNEYVESVR